MVGEWMESLTVNSYLNNVFPEVMCCLIVSNIQK